MRQGTPNRKGKINNLKVHGEQQGATHGEKASVSTKALTQWGLRDICGMDLQIWRSEGSFSPRWRAHCEGDWIRRSLFTEKEKEKAVGYVKLGYLLYRNDMPSSLQLR